MSRASACSFTRAAKAASISSPLLALRTWTCSPISGAAAFTSFTVLSALSTLLGFTSTPMRAVLGRSSDLIPSLFFVSSAEKKLIPVALLSGRERLATRPSLTGSSPTPNTIGIVVVAAFAASAAGVLAEVTITLTRRRIRSSTSSGNRWYWPSAQRYSIDTFWPSTKPDSLRPRRNAVNQWGCSPANVTLRNPITGIAACCARAASGHAAAAPPTSVMNSRRFTASDSRASHRKDSTPRHGRLLHPTPVRNEMIAVTPPIIFSKEVAQKQATPLPRQSLPQHQKSFYAEFPGMGPG